MPENINPNPVPKPESEPTRRDMFGILGGAAVAAAGAMAGSGEAEARPMILEGRAAAVFEQDVTDKCAQAFAGKLVKTNAISAKILGGGANASGPLTVGVYDDKQSLIGEVIVPGADRGMFLSRVTVSMISDLLEAKGFLKK